MGLFCWHGAGVLLISVNLNWGCTVEFGETVILEEELHLEIPRELRF